MTRNSRDNRLSSLFKRFNSIRREKGLKIACFRAIKYFSRYVKPSNIKYDIKVNLGRIKPQEVVISHPRANFQMLGPWTHGAGVGKDYPETGCHEYPVTGAFIKIMGSINHPIFFDVGAAFGYYSLLASQSTDANNIHIFEGDKTNLRYLRMNNQRYANEDMKINDNFVGADQLRLDEYSNNTVQPDVIKIDVDGLENDVLLSMEGLFKNGRNYPYIFLEIHMWGNYCYRIDEIKKFFDGLPYRIYLCINHRNPKSTFSEVNLSELPSEPLESARDYMVILCPEDNEIRLNEALMV